MDKMKSRGSTWLRRVGHGPTAPANRPDRGVFVSFEPRTGTGLVAERRAAVCSGLNIFHNPNIGGCQGRAVTAGTKKTGQAQGLPGMADRSRPADTGSAASRGNIVVVVVIVIVIVVANRPLPRGGAWSSASLAWLKPSRLSCWVTSPWVKEAPPEEKKMFMPPLPLADASTARTAQPADRGGGGQLGLDLAPLAGGEGDPARGEEQPPLELFDFAEPPPLRPPTLPW